MTLARIRTGETVVVISGRDKGKTGKVLRVWAEDNKVLVEKINVLKKHAKPTQTTEGGILEREAPIHISNVMPIDPETGKGTRIKTRIESDKSKTRVAAKSGAALDEPKRDRAAKE
ncbi:MAG: 50S ribosomal protein L24 [Deltaproteobacteria bacterium]|nr:50S ribosomal protein L24 [Deltaproteobacteria bacterium]